VLLPNQVLVVTGQNFGTGLAGGNPARIFISSTTIDPRTNALFVLECLQTNTPQSHTTTECAVPAGQGANLVVTVSVAGQVSTTSRPFAYSRPVVNSVNPTALPTSGGTLTLAGAQFGVGWLGFRSYELLVNGVNVTNSGSVALYNHTHIFVTVGAGSGANKPISLTVGGQTPVSQPSFNYAPPTVTKVEGCVEDVDPRAAGCSLFGGDNVRVTGTNFGTVATAGLLFMTIGGPFPLTARNCTINVASVTHTGFNCTLPSWPSGDLFNLPVTVTLDGLPSSTSAATVSYSGPEIFGNSLVLWPTDTTLGTGSVALSTDPAVSGAVRVSFAGRNWGSNISAITITVRGNYPSV